MSYYVINDEMWLNALRPIICISIYVDVILKLIKVKAPKFRIYNAPKCENNDIRMNIINKLMFIDGNDNVALMF